MEIRSEENVILPEQLPVGSMVEQSGEVGLLWAILHDAIYDYDQGCRLGAFQSRDFCEAERWLFSDDRTWLTSFENICDILDINIKHLRFHLCELRIGWTSERFARAS